MNYEILIQYLMQWTDDEKILFHYQRAKNDPEKLAAFFSSLSDDNPLKHKLLNRNMLPCYMNESNIIAPEKNVILIKHARYEPVFIHRHHFFELIYVLTGKCMQLLPANKTITLKRGDLYLMAPETPHGLSVPDDSIILNIVIRRSTFLDMFANAVRDKNYLSVFFLKNIYGKDACRYLIYHTDGDKLLRNYILDMYLEQLADDEYSDRIICSMLLIFFNQLLRRYGRSVEIADNTKKSSPFEDEILYYIENHYSTVTLNELADRFHLSVAYTSKLIKSIAGMPFSHLLSNIRVDAGEKLLLTTNLSIGMISERVGYANPETFIRAFRKRYGLTPTQYRNK